MDGWSGAGQRDYHYSLYNKRKFEEVYIYINLDILQINCYSILSNYKCMLLLTPFIVHCYAVYYHYSFLLQDICFTLYLSSGALFIS